MTPKLKEKHLLRIPTRCRAILWCVFILLGLNALSGPQTVHGAEGAVDYYMQGGIYGNFGIAKLPGKGLYYLNYLVYQNGEADAAVRGGVSMRISKTTSAPMPLPWRTSPTGSSSAAIMSSARRRLLWVPRSMPA